MNYIDYLSNAEKHYCFCNNVISENWEDKFAQDFKQKIVEKLYNSLKSFDYNNYLNKNTLSQSFDSIIHIADFSDDYSVVEPIFTEWFDNLAINVYGSALTNNIKKKEQKRGNYLRYVKIQYEEYRRALYNMYLNTYYLSGYIFEGLAIYSVLKLLGFDDSINLGGNAQQRLTDLSNYRNYVFSQLTVYVSGTSTINTTLRTKFAGINKHKFNDYISVIRNHPNLNNYLKNIEFVGQDITDATLKQMVDNWNNNILRYKQFSSFDLSKNDLIELLKLSNRIIEQVKHI